MPPTYAELQVTSNFSFLRGASHPDELVQRAAKLGYHAIALTDRHTVAGVVRGHVAAQEHGIKFLPGTRLDLTDGQALLCLPTDKPAWERLSSLLTIGKLRGQKGECHLTFDDLESHAPGQIAIALPPANLFTSGDRQTVEAFEAFATNLAQLFTAGTYIAGHRLYRGDDLHDLRHLAELTQRVRVPMVATNDVHYHDPARRRLQDVVTCIRRHTTLAKAGRRLFANAERYLKSMPAMASLFAEFPEAIANSITIADAVSFSLSDLRYVYPTQLSVADLTPDQELRRRLTVALQERFPRGPTPRLRQLLDHELALITELNYAPYFLTVHDIMQFARAQNILCQGRGSAANSALCYCLGITNVNPEAIDPLFERFVSRERDEPPDIDVDFEHERREEVIQHIYSTYGRERAGLAATVITYRSRSALREVGKVFGLTTDSLAALSAAAKLRRDDPFAHENFTEVGLDPDGQQLRTVVALAHELTRFPRHLSQHPGGFVITDGPLHHLCPIANAAMADRTTLEWDKDDLDALGILKIDVLGLGMLSCIRKALDLLAEHHGRHLTLPRIPEEDAEVYDMLCAGDAVGVFQVESRAQLAMLPRLRPRKFFDLVIEVAIVRPGPIQGDMVHPFLRRRSGKEKISYPSAELEEVLGSTLGVPLFQEQAMKIAIVAAGFTPDEADRLRRAMNAHRYGGSLEKLRQRFITGMTRRKYSPKFAEQCFRQIEGFGNYGFPQSHAASFAVLVYASAWLKCHYPAAFACALLNSQPMGFYAPAQIISDARAHGVTVRGVDINASEPDCTLEWTSDGAPAIRLGFRQVRGLSTAATASLVANRQNGYADPLAVHRRAQLPTRALVQLAEADAFAALGLSRRDAIWSVRRLPDQPLPLFAAIGETGLPDEPNVVWPTLTPAQEVSEDYATFGMSLRNHPLALLRADRGDIGRRLRHTTSIDMLTTSANGTRLEVAGLVLSRQRPHTASGVMFMTVEDETGIANVIVWPNILDRFRVTAVTGQLLAVKGRLQREGIVTHVIAEHLDDLSGMLEEMRLPGDTQREHAITQPRREFR